MQKATSFDWKYIMTASCESDTIQFAGDYIIQNKSNVAIVIVIFDLAISFSLWFSLLALKPFQNITDVDIDRGNLSAEDFTVQIIQEPHKDHINDIKGIYWAWVEEILQKEEQVFTDPATLKVDELQNNVFNINYGESMKEMLPFYKKMGKQLIAKKRFEKKVDLTDDIDKKLEYSKKLH